MDTPILVAVISAAAAILVSAGSFYLTKKKEREADQHRHKFEQYQEFLTAVRGIVGTDSTPETNRRFATACNTLYLMASPEVIAAMLVSVSRRKPELQMSINRF